MSDEKKRGPEFRPVFRAELGNADDVGICNWDRFSGPEVCPSCGQVSPTSSELQSLVGLDSSRLFGITDSEV